MLKLDLILPIMNYNATPLIDHYQKEKRKVIGLMKFELDGKIMTKFIRLRTKMYSYLIQNSSEEKKAKGTKNCVVRRKLKFENYKNYLEKSQLDNEIKYLEKDID